MLLIQRLLFLVLLAALAVAAFQNQQHLGMPLEFAFLRWRFSMVLGFWLLSAFLTGGLLFLLLDAWRNFRLRWEIRRRDQQIARLEEALRQPPPPSPPPAE